MIRSASTTIIGVVPKSLMVKVAVTRHGQSDRTDKVVDSDSHLGRSEQLYCRYDTTVLKFRPIIRITAQ